MNARPTRIISVTNQPTSIRKVAAFANDPNAYPVVESRLQYPSGGGTVELLSEQQVKQAAGALTAVTNPLNTETISVNGISFTFVTGASTSTNVHIGADKETTMANFALVLNASANAAINIATYTSSGAVLTITFTAPGDAGNAYTLANSSGSVAVTRSGATLTGGGPSPGAGEAVAVAALFTDRDQSIRRYAIASTGTISLNVTDFGA